MKGKWGLVTLFVVFGCLGVCASARAHWEDIPDLLLLVNQSGYETEGFKHFLIQSKKPLFEVEGEFSLTDETGKAVFTGKLGPVVQAKWRGRNQPWFRKGSFTEFHQPGTYRITTRIGSHTYISYPFEIGEKILVKKTAWLVSKFLNGQRCGCNNFLHSGCHLDDALNDRGEQVDVTGGWHDAGNYPKMALTISLCTYGLARFAASEAYKSYIHADKNIPTPLEEAIWGAAYLGKIQDPKSHRLLGNVDYRVSRLSPEHLELLQTRGRNRQWEYFLPPDGCSDNKPGTGDERAFGRGGLPRMYPYSTYERAGGTPVVLSVEGGEGESQPIVCVTGKKEAAVSAYLPGYRGDALEEGTQVYLDRDYKLSSLPTELGGGICIRTFNDHKDQRTGGTVFELAREATVYVVFDGRSEAYPEWLKNNRFEKATAELSLVNSKGEKWGYVAFRKDFPVGRVRLGANLPKKGGSDGTACNYFVVAVPKEEIHTTKPLVRDVRYCVASVEAAPEARLLSASRRALRRVPRPLERGVFFRQFARWPEGYSLRIDAPKDATVYLAFHPGIAELPTNVRKQGFRKSGFQLELWEHRFTGGVWGSWFTRSNAYTVAAYACLYRATGEKRYLDDAVALWQTIIHDPSDVIGDSALLMADTELYRIGQEERFLKDGALRIRRLADRQAKAGNWPGSGHLYSMHEGEVASALADHLLAVPKTPAARDARRALKKYVKWSRALSHNIFRIKQVSRDRILSSRGRTGVYTAQARALWLAQRVLGEDEELDEIAIACTDWILGINSYGTCLMSGAGSKHMSRYWAYYRPEELPGSSGAGIVTGSSTSDTPYLDVRPRGTRRANGEGQTGEPSIHRGGLWMLLLSDY